MPLHRGAIGWFVICDWGNFLSRQLVLASCLGDLSLILTRPTLSPTEKEFELFFLLHFVEMIEVIPESIYT